MTMMLECHTWTSHLTDAVPTACDQCKSADIKSETIYEAITEAGSDAPSAMLPLCRLNQCQTCTDEYEE